MRIASFNINGVVGRLDNLLAWLTATRPDVVCLQELKLGNRGFPAEAIRASGYDAAWVSAGRWNGVAILSRIGAPVVTRRALPGDSGDDQARYIEAAVGGVVIACLYLPNGNPQPGPKFDYKLAWFERLIAHAADLLDSGAPVVLAGDFNVVPTEADIYNSRSWKTNALLQPRPRAAFARLLDLGWTDAIRARFPDDPPPWTFWQYFRQAWERDAGLRIDHLLLSPSLADRLTGAGVDRAVRGEPGASDHAPVWMELMPKRRGGR